MNPYINLLVLRLALARARQDIKNNLATCNPPGLSIQPASLVRRQPRGNARRFALSKPYKGQTQENQYRPSSYFFLAIAAVEPTMVLLLSHKPGCHPHCLRNACLLWLLWLPRRAATHAHISSFLPLQPEVLLRVPSETSVSL